MSLIIDQGCTDSLCASGINRPTENNFSEETNDKILKVLMFLLVYKTIISFYIEYCLYPCLSKKSKSCNDKWNVFRTINKYEYILSVILFIITIIYYYTTREINICEFNDYCNFKNDTLEVYKLYYKLINNKCPNHNELLYMYSDEYIYNSEEIACKINIQCELTVIYKETEEHYNNLVKYDRGYMTLLMDKKGCPDIKDIILDVTKIHNNNLFNNIIIVICFDLTLSLIITLSFVYCYSDRPNKKEHHKLNNEKPDKRVTFEEQIKLTEKNVTFKFQAIV
jgi:hypothetical protein